MHDSFIYGVIRTAFGRSPGLSVSITAQPNDPPLIDALLGREMLDDVDQRRSLTRLGRRSNLFKQNDAIAAGPGS